MTISFSAKTAICRPPGALKPRFSSPRRNLERFGRIIVQIQRLWTRFRAIFRFRTLTDFSCPNTIMLRQPRCPHPCVPSMFLVHFGGVFGHILKHDMCPKIPPKCLQHVPSLGEVPALRDGWPHFMRPFLRHTNSKNARQTAENSSKSKINPIYG